MQKQLECVVIRLCEQLPLNITLFEEDGLCKKPACNCKYRRKDIKNVYLCYKKTYVYDADFEVT